ncbi:MAG: N-formylglutamate amidohydrolase, partial [Bdellovibrionales bacterium]
MKAFFITIPHSGERIPEEAPWLKGRDEVFLMDDVDRYVDRLYSPVLQKLALPFVKTDWHRYALDLNRLPDDVDQDSVIGSPNPPGKFPTGLHWVRSMKGQNILPQPISRELHERLVEKYFEPFHAAVRAQYDFFFANGARPVFQLDAHSMPSLGTKNHRDPGERRADIVVSDCKGLSCSTSYKDLVIESYRSTGLKVAYNWPYFGGRVTETYGHPEKGQEAIQVEINRDLYMDEKTKQWKPKEGQSLSEKLTQAVEAIFKALPDVS